MKDPWESWGPFSECGPKECGREGEVLSECLAGSANDLQRSRASVLWDADGARLCEGPASWSCEVANAPRPLPRTRGGISNLSKIKQVAQQNIYKTKLEK